MSFIDWKDSFDDVFASHPDNWVLTFVHRNDKGQHTKLQNQRKMDKNGYAKFHCPKCSNSWASAKAMAILYHPNPNQPRGKVTLRLFGQQCRRCSRVNDYFVDPEFEDDSIRLTLDKLYNKFKWVYYGEERPKRAERRDDRPNKIEGPHKKELCEACRMGCCEQARATKTY